MKTVLVIREFDRFSRILSENGFAVINCPATRTEALKDLSDFDAKLSALENYDGIFVTSRRAAEVFRAKLRETNVKYGGKVYVLGARSFELLKNENLNLIFSESANTAAEMLAAIPPPELAGKRFLFVRGEKSLRVVPDFLARAAVSVEETIVYRSVKIPLETFKIKEIENALKTGEIAAACFFSPSAAESFLQQFDAEKLHQTRIATIGKTTAEFFAGRNLKVDFIAAKAAAEDFAVELIEYLNKIAKDRNTFETQRREDAEMKKKS
jgi:uroporphyrinogen-III synthase